ncbi:hypothetical protein O7614_20365 [Micromonospora sp. WMMD961]|uniref:hypothetical protein n=1 Tax=Micromonospora sp. WMMD961 TaxID=3016100 RepID=UPI002416C81F|nr:hypothetical protein [Micromonospora sp. WMMD961]MDG4782017.1 hypothetical protein [Micromonospora sp. WMMD961]
MSPLWLHVKSSVARWGVVPLGLLGVAILFGRSRYWIGIWPEAGAAAQLSAFFLSIFAAGVTAWVAATIDVRGMYEQAASAAIRPLTIELTRFTAALLWLLVPYLAVATAAFVATAAGSFPPGLGSFFLYILLGVVTIVFAAAWGWLVGRLLAPLIAAVCAALSWFIAVSLLGDSTDATVMSGPPWFEVSLGPIGVRLAAVLLLAVAVCALPWRAGRPARFRQRALLALVALAGVVAVHVSTTVLVHRSPVAKPVCVQGEIEYCLWPEHEKYVPMVEAVDRRVTALPVRLPLPDRVVDYSLSGSQKWTDLYSSVQLPGTFAPEFDISEGSEWALARGVASAIVSAVFAECDPDAKQDPEYRSDQLHAWLEWRLVGGGTPDYRTDAPDYLRKAWSAGRQQAAEESDQDQGRWATTLIAETKERYCRAA